MSKLGQEEAMAEDAKRRRLSCFKSLHATCQARLDEVKLCTAELTYEQLIDTSFWHRLRSVDCHSLLGAYPYMGRAFTGEVLEFILEEKEALIKTEYEGHIKYLSGTPGFGKTISLHTAVTYLYLRSLQILPPKTSGKQVDVSGYRFALLWGRRFVEDSAQVLRTALVMAYIKDDGALADLREAESALEMTRFLQQRTEKVIIVVDDGNAFDEEGKDTDAKRVMKEAAYDLLMSLISDNVKVIICASVRSKLRRVVSKRASHFLLKCGGLSEEEVCKLIQYRRSLRKEAIDRSQSLAEARRMLASTGWVPRLVVSYLENKLAFTTCVRELERDVEKYISETLQTGGPDMHHLLAAVAGSKLRHPLPSVLDSRCYYPAPGGSRCLTSELHAFAIGAITSGVTRRDRYEALAQVGHFTRAIWTMDNLSFIGWSSEAATLIVLKLLRPVLPVVNLVVDPDAVVVFPGRRLTRKLVESLRGRYLLIPKKFNHAGVDAYYITPDAIVAMQISVAREYEKCHAKTIEVAEQLFHGDGRKKIVAWIVNEVKPDLVEGELFDTLYVPFADLHESLAGISDRLTALRGSQGVLCPKCKKPSGEVGCDHCGSWFHKECEPTSVEGAPWYCSECSIGLDYGESDLDDDAGAADPDYRP